MKTQSPLTRLERLIRHDRGLKATAKFKRRSAASDLKSARLFPVMNPLLRALAVFITIFGVGSLAIGLAALLVVDMSVENMRLMRDEGHPALPGVDLETFRWVMYANAVALIISGILSAVSGVGLFLKRNWGRLLWLGTLGLLMIGTVYSLVMNYINRSDWDRVISNCLVLLVYMALFYFFSRASTKELFVRNNYAA